MQSLSTCYRSSSWVLLVKLLSGECHRTSAVICLFWFRYWFGADKQRAITWSNVDADLCHHVASLGHMVNKYPDSSNEIQLWLQQTKQNKTMNTHTHTHIYIYIFNDTYSPYAQAYTDVAENCGTKELLHNVLSWLQQWIIYIDCKFKAFTIWCWCPNQQMRNHLY